MSAKGSQNRVFHSLKIIVLESVSDKGKVQVIRSKCMHKIVKKFTATFTSGSETHTSKWKLHMVMRIVTNEEVRSPTCIREDIKRQETEFLLTLLIP